MREMPSVYQSFLESLPIIWPLVEFWQLGLVYGGSTPSRDNPAFWNGNINWVTPGEVSDEREKYLADTAEKITKSGLNGSGANLLPAGSLLVTTRATLGARVITSIPIATNQGFRSIVFKRPADADFYYYLLEKIKPELIRRASGTTFLEISGREFSSIPVPNPCDEEKRKIAQILDTLDTAIRKTEAIIEKLKRIKQGLLHDLLTRGIDANGELRPPPELAPHLYKESPLGLVPKEWEIKTGYNVCDEIVVGIVIRPTQYYKDNGVPILRSANVREDGINLTDLVYMSGLDHISQRKSAVCPGNVLTVRTGYPGTSCIVDERIAEANCVDVIISKPSKSMLSKYWAEWINSPYGKDQVIKVQGGLAQQHFNVGELQNMLIHLPSIEEQKRIVNCIEEAKCRIQTEILCKEKLIKTKTALMNDLLTGQVRVTPLLEGGNGPHKPAMPEEPTA